MQFYKKYFFIILIIFSIIQLGNVLTQASPKFILVYVVQSGDTLSDIASEYRISVNELKEINNISSSIDLRPGDELIVSETKPETDSRKNFNFNTNLFKNESVENYSLNIEGTYAVRINKEKSLPEVDIPESEIIEYMIKQGDTLYDLAREFNTTSGVIMALNDMENNIVRTGQLIKVPTNNLTPRQVLARTIQPQEKELLARVIHAEARGEPFQGQVAVGAVIINRIIHSSFPDTIRDVIYQSGQFTAVYDGQIKLDPNAQSFQAAKKALNGLDPTMGSIYYYNPKIAENKWWFNDKTVNVIIGEHVFAQ